MISRLLSRAGLVLFCVWLSACSSFDAQWKVAKTSAAASRWEGHWTSEKHRAPRGNPMGGRLRAVMEPTQQGGLATTFHANWMMFASDYSMTLEPKKKTAGPAKEGREFQGSHELPQIFGGTYHYEARMTGNRFTARYTSSYDHGTFALQRLPDAKDYVPSHARH